MADDEEAPPTPQWFTNKEGEAAGPFNEEGLPHGQGVMKYPPPPAGEDDEEEKPGDMYEGSMVNGKREGKGKYTWSNGAIFEGTYADNKKQGRGRLTLPNKSVFEGNYVDDQMEGDGRYVYGNGDIYQGQFKSGKRHGNGIYHYKDVGCQLVGDWEEGCFTKGRWILKDGSIFYGTFSKSLSPQEGAHYFTRTHLLQKGSYSKAGTWSGEEPQLGGPDMLLKLVRPAH